MIIGYELKYLCILRTWTSIENYMVKYISILQYSISASGWLQLEDSHDPQDPARSAARAALCVATRAPRAADCSRSATGVALAPPAARTHVRVRRCAAESGGTRVASRPERQTRRAALGAAPAAMAGRARRDCVWWHVGAEKTGSGPDARAQQRARRRSAARRAERSELLRRPLRAAAWTRDLHNQRTSKYKWLNEVTNSLSTLYSIQ